MRVLVASSSRADFGLLIPVIRELGKDAFFEVSVCEVGSHISSHSENYQILKSAGLPKVSLSINTPFEDTAEGKAKFAAEVIVNLTDYLSRSTTDAILILGDRYETLALAYAASLSNIPIIHLVGGDLTFGSLDDNYRHAITKLARIHFVTNSESYNRVLQMGEEFECVCVSGSPGLDDIKNYDFVTQEKLEEYVGLKFQKQIILVTFHPDSLKPNEVEKQVLELTTALETFLPQATILLTGANFDSGYTKINQTFQTFANKHPNSVRFIENLGTRNYLSMLHIASLMVGNSSSGYYEAPSFNLPVVDLGSRQNGRVPHRLLINVPVESGEIIAAMKVALKREHVDVVNPYGSGESALRIKEFLKNLTKEDLKASKRFIELTKKDLS